MIFNYCRNSLDIGGFSIQLIAITMVARFRLKIVQVLINNLSNFQKQISKHGIGLHRNHFQCRLPVRHFNENKKTSIFSLIFLSFCFYIVAKNFIKKHLRKKEDNQILRERNCMYFMYEIIGCKRYYIVLFVSWNVFYIP